MGRMDNFDSLGGDKLPDEPVVRRAGLLRSIRCTFVAGEVVSRVSAYVSDDESPEHSMARIQSMAEQREALRMLEENGGILVDCPRIKCTDCPNKSTKSDQSGSDLVWRSGAGTVEGLVNDIASGVV